MRSGSGRSGSARSHSVLSGSGRSGYAAGCAAKATPRRKSLTSIGAAPLVRPAAQTPSPHTRRHSRYEQTWYARNNQ
jgi:hypothetical protein